MLDQRAADQAQLVLDERRQVDGERHGLPAAKDARPGHEDGPERHLDESAAERDLGELHRQREIELVPARVQLTQPDGAVVAQLERTALQEEAAVVADAEGTEVGLVRHVEAEVGHHDLEGLGAHRL
jgi:hypothetical protein